jgi:hypothetical protein
VFLPHYFFEFFRPPFAGENLIGHKSPETRRSKEAKKIRVTPSYVNVRAQHKWSVFVQKRK